MKTNIKIEKSSSIELSVPDARFSTLCTIHTHAHSNDSTFKYKFVRFFPLSSLSFAYFFNFNSEMKKEKKKHEKYYVDDELSFITFYFFLWPFALAFFFPFLKTQS